VRDPDFTTVWAPVPTITTSVAVLGKSALRALRHGVRFQRYESPWELDFFQTVHQMWIRLRGYELAAGHLERPHTAAKAMGLCASVVDSDGFNLDRNRIDRSFFSVLAILN